MQLEEPSVHSMMDTEMNPILVNGRFFIWSLMNNMQDNPGLENAVGTAFDALGIHAPSAKMEYYQQGDYSFVFLLTANQRNIIMQIGKDTVGSPVGAVVSDDGQNLARIAQHAPGYTPAVHATDTVDICDVSQVPVLFTEYLDGYHELISADHRLRTNRPAEKDLFFHGEESDTIFRSIVTIPLYIFARTYNPVANEGSIVDNIKIGAGDFLYRTFDSSIDPLTQLITARELGIGKSAQLLRMVSSLADYQLSINGNRIHPAQYQRHVERTDALLEEVGMQVLRSVFRSDAEKIWDRWSDSYVSESESGLRDVLQSLPTQASYADIPPWYRSVIRDKVERVYRSLRILERDDCEDSSAIKHHERDLALRIAQQVPYNDLVALFDDPNPMREAKIAFREPFEQVVGEIEPHAFQHAIDGI